MDAGGPSFTWQASDGETTSAVAVVTIDLAAIDDPPVATDGAVTTDEDTPVEVDLSDYVVDVDSLALTWSVDEALGGTVTLIDQGPLARFEPAQDAFGDTGFGFSFSANDGASDSNTAALSVTVRLRHVPLVMPRSIRLVLR